MPYTAVTKDGIRLENIPDTMTPDSPQLQQIVMQERTRRHHASPEYQAKVREQQERDRIEYDPTKGMGPIERGFANYQAGVYNVGRGIKDVWTDLTGTKEQKAENEADILEARARDKRLADSTTGGKALQFVGEATPSLLLPGGVGGGVLRQAVSGAAMGAGQAALQATAGDESRGMNMLAGGAVGGALPLALAAAKGIYSNLTRRGAENRAARFAQEAVGGTPADATNAVAKINTNWKPGAQNVPQTSAELLQNTGLAQAERESRMLPAQRGAWTDLDRTRAEEAWKAVQGATGSAEKAGELATARGDLWEANMQKALANTRPRNFERGMKDLSIYLDDLAHSPEGIKPGVRGAIAEINEMLAAAGDQISPAHLAAIRTELNQSAKLVPGASPLQSANRNAPAIIEMKGKLDEILNKSTGGKWQRVLDDFIKASPDVDAARGAQAVRDVFVEPSTGAVRGAGSRYGTNLPEVTPTRLTTALGSAARGRETRLSDEAVEHLTNLQEVLRGRNIVEGVGRTGTAGAGPTTAGDLALRAGEAGSKRVLPSEAVPYLGKLYELGKQRSERLYSERLGDALRNPEALRELLERKVRLGQGLSQQEQALLSSLRGGAIASTMGR